ncbi:uncharacterized protein LOC126673534 isoform X2 [Mercurialis annua]|uniref:uncharacterized protein LOC126673534 isoform X2 n=1 Tax=Mercurialis annua TaxID=3986 RepID=UPI002160E1EE|nr:uncharacterized protein LOC126673534 isoform X2 [Mercurialis annua]
MEGIKETESQEEIEEHEEQNNCFVWDDNSQLYYHPRSGFYHDPNAGWYYSSSDGLYYKFENGSYVLFEYDKVNDCVSHGCQETVQHNTAQENTEDDISLLTVDQPDVYSCGQNVSDESIPRAEHSADQEAEMPRPPSEWLEETLINIYLSAGKKHVNDADISTMPSDVDGTSPEDSQVLKDGQLSEHHCSLTGESGCTIDEDVCKDEENWLAQYGQVVYSGEQSVQDFQVVNLWDWAMVTDSGKDIKGHTTRLIGRLVKRSAKLHPSMPSSSGFFRTAPICEAHLDLVRVRTGQVYKLHNPSARYLSTLSSYDSSNPTADWGYPEVSINVQAIPATKSFGKSEPVLDDENSDKAIALSPNELPTSKKQRIHHYRDRAAERRTLHGGYGAGPGQKSSSFDVSDATSSVSTSTEEAAAEALNMSLGVGTYGRKILENMGWKEGEGLGKTVKGLTTPIQPVGNTGNAGLGWSRGRST